MRDELWMIAVVIICGIFAAYMAIASLIIECKEKEGWAHMKCPMIEAISNLHHQVQKLK